MNATIEPLAPSILTDEKIIAALKRSGPLTIEEMSSIPGMSWVRVFSAVDRLSRLGVVSLRRIGLRVPGGLQPDYPVSAGIIHKDFYLNRQNAAATSLTAGGLARWYPAARVRRWASEASRCGNTGDQ